MITPKRCGRKPVSTRIGHRDENRAKLNAALAKRGERTIRPQDEINAEFRRSKHFAERDNLTAEAQRTQRKAGK